MAPKRAVGSGQNGGTTPKSKAAKRRRASRSPQREVGRGSAGSDGDGDGSRPATPLHLSPEGGAAPSFEAVAAPRPAGRPSELVRNAVQQSLAARRALHGTSDSPSRHDADAQEQAGGRPSTRLSGRPSMRLRDAPPSIDILRPLRASVAVVGVPAGTPGSEAKIELEPFVLGPESHPTSGWKGTFTSLVLHGVDGSGGGRRLAGMVSVLLPNSMASSVMTERHEAYDD